jgi:ketosteroid isomerase-like protein
MRATSRRVTLTAIAGGLLAACPAATTPEITNEDRVAIRQVVDSAMVLANGATKDWSAYVDLYYAADAQLLPPNQAAVAGRDALIAFLGGFPPFTDFRLEVGTMEGQGGYAWVHGRYSMTVTMPGAAPAKDEGKYLEVWQKQADGSWKSIRDMFSSDLPLPAPPPPPPGPPRAN